MPPFSRRSLLAATALVVALATPMAMNAILTVRAGDEAPAATVAMAPASPGEIVAIDAKPGTISVSAQADVHMAPDIATINAGVVSQAATAVDAMKDNSNKMQAIFGALKKAGVADKDMQSAGVNISPVYKYADNMPPTVTGYQASNTVNVVLRDMGDIGNVIDALVGQGVNQFSGPSFDVEDKDAALDKARSEAVAKARARADLYAKAAGVTLSRLQSLNEQGMMMPQPFPGMYKMAAMERADAAPTPIAAGEVTLSVTVGLTYEVSQ